MADAPSPPPGDWQKAQRVIRALFLQEKYRQCIQFCRDFLKATANDHDPHPVQDAYINFYLGLCHHEVARMMHHNSVAKLPAFEEAEKHYLEALTALPTAKDARELCVRQIEEKVPEDPFMEQKNDFGLPLPASPTFTDNGLFDKPRSRASTLMLSSPPTRCQSDENVPVISPLGSPALQSFDVDVKDVESHDSFSELMTPSRVQRDYGNFDQTSRLPQYLRRTASRMSLVEDSPRMNTLPRVSSRMSLFDKTPPPRPKPPVQTKGLMRPIRVGSPDKRRSVINNKVPYSGAFASSAYLRSNLPKLSTGWNPRMSAPQLSQYNTEPFSPDFVSPVSPISPSSPVRSHGSSVSPISPIATDVLDYMYSSDQLTKSTTITPNTPADLMHYNTPELAPAVKPVSAPLPPKQVFDAAMFARVSDHLTAMRAQLETHMKSVQQAREQVHRAQALQALSRPRSNGSKRQTTTGRSVSRQKSLQKSRSYWSFAPEDQKARKKKERIEGGRERKWKKERFDPAKYQKLCEHALNEL